MTLGEKTGGAAYGETALSVDDRLKTLFPEFKATNRPSVVWFSDPSDEKSIKKIDGTIMCNENVGVCLKRFNCYRVNVLDIPEGEIQDMYKKKVPAFYFFDPANALVKKVSGKRATSLSGFSKLMEYTWDKSFTMRLKVFTKQIKKILDRFDKHDTKRTSLDRQKTKLLKRPNRAKQAKLDKEQAKLDAEKEKIEEDEKAVTEECKLKKEFLPASEDNE